MCITSQVNIIGSAHLVTIDEDGFIRSVPGAGADILQAPVFSKTSPGFNSVPSGMLTSVMKVARSQTGVLVGVVVSVGGSEGVLVGVGEAVCVGSSG
ncbi:MAG: hypothetical protein JEZ06_13340 [Anaerolineaceae bacterium]|nr:hypothetical protein [Anaerolineaceae bacterium]